MQATIKTFDKGKLGLQAETFTLPIELAKKVVGELNPGPGTYWESAKKALRRAVRAKQDKLQIHTAGFGTEELHSVIIRVGGTTVSE